MNLKMQKAKIDVWGIGTKLITAFDQPALGAVYKLVSFEDEHGKMIDTVKISSNAAKVSTPGKKQVWRITDRSDGKTEGDYVSLWDEDPREQDSIYMFNPDYTYINKTVENFDARPILQPIFDQGKLIYKVPELSEIRHFSKQHLDMLWDEYKRDLNPQIYPVDLSQNCYDNKMEIIQHVRDYVNQLKF